MSDQPGETNTRSTPTRPWWRKRRWIVVGLLWLGFGYLLSSGPARYAEARGWLSNSTVRAYNRPGWLLAWRVPYMPSVFFPYREWWYQHGLEDRIHVYEGGMSGPGWKISVSYRGVAAISSQIGRSWTDRDGATFDSYTLEFAAHKFTVDNGRRQPDGSVLWDGPITFDDQPVATIPAGTRKIAIEYIDGEIAVEADGVEIEVDQLRE